MIRAIVIRTIGDTAMSDAIVDGMKQHVIPLDGGELTRCMAELAVLKTRDSRHWEDEIAAAWDKYGSVTRRPGRLVERIQGAWARLYLTVKGLE